MLAGKTAILTSSSADTSPYDFFTRSAVIAYVTAMALPIGLALQARLAEGLGPPDELVNAINAEERYIF